MQLQKAHGTTSIAFSSCADLKTIHTVDTLPHVCYNYIVILSTEVAKLKGKLFFVLIIILATVFCLFGCDSFGNDKLEDKIYKITVSNPEHAKIFIQTEDIGDSWVTELEVKRGTRINIKSECDEGWECVDYSLSNGENIYAQGFFIATGDAVLTADSRLITYSINYKIGGADINPNEQTEYTYFDSILKLETPTKYGADFIGWKINGEGDYVTEVDLSQIRNDFSIIAYWNEYFNLEYHGAGNYFDCYEITSLTEYGASKTEIYVPDTYNGKNIVAIGGLKNISIVTLMLEDLYIGANVKHIDDEVYESVSNIRLTEESSYFYEQGNFFLSNSSILFINEGYFANGNDALYIDDEISDVEAFGQKNIDLIKRFYVNDLTVIQFPEAEHIL